LQMSLILGMDTGGTFTDGVILENETKTILAKAKAPTTKENLTIGLRGALDALNFSQWSKIELVSLSTTLATNAIVEGKGGRVALIYMGTEIDEPLPEVISIKVKGKYTIMGECVEDTDEEEIKGALMELKGKVDAIAISGYAGVRNPKHEKLIRSFVQELLGVPTVCAHQLTSALGFHHRTVTAILNAKLIPIIEELLSSTKAVLMEKGITAPVMIVKGDGTLMSEETAKEKPIDTILSGPAASVMGGLFLTGCADGLVVDMGGTTTDIAHISEGRVKTKPEGAKVGGWYTRVQAAEISTFGLGGDSRIFLQPDGSIQIGPEKVTPISLAGKEHPLLIHELKSFQRVGEFKTYLAQETDCFRRLSLAEEDEEDRVLSLLASGPHSLTYIAKALGQDPETLDLTSYVK
ncbi:MAG: hydantoinase/oxoprolinase family protein, partial [Anaerovoracaceae bacterium]